MICNSQGTRVKENGMSLVLAVDLGGSGLKLGVFAAEGHLLAQARVTLAFDEPQQGQSQADPALWWQALVTGAAQIEAQAAGVLARVRMVALCGFTRTQVLLDDQAQVLRPAFGFRDNRAEAIATDLRARLSGAEALNGFHPLARLAWLRQHEPEFWNKLHRVIEPKDYLILRLTGEICGDQISLKLLQDSLQGPNSLAAQAGLAKDLLPPLGQPMDVVGQIRAGLPGALAQMAGVQVMLGSNDTWMAVAGMAAMAPGRSYCISGSSEVLGLLTPTPAMAEGLVRVQWGPDLWHLGGPGQNGSNVIDWTAEVFAPAAGQAQANHGLLFLPFLQGERVPYWDGDLRAAMLGLDAQTTAADLQRAAMEGIAHLNRIVLNRAEAATGVKAPDIRMGGGGSRNAAWNQIRADVTGRDILVSPATEMGLAGGHACARLALGEASDLEAAAQVSLPPFQHYVPNPATRAHHDEMHQIFLQAHEALAPISHRLAKVPRAGI